MFDAFNIPATTAGDDGWMRYTTPIRIDARAAQFMYLDNETPEAATAHFYASLIRCDDAYREVIPDRWDAPAYLEGKLRKLTAWTFIVVELLGKKPRGKRSLYLRIRARVLIDGVSHVHEDEVTLVKQNDGNWLVRRPPT